MTAQKFFRYLWRIDAILILLAAGAITFGIGALLVSEFGGRTAMRRNAEAGVPVAAGPRADLFLGHAQAVTGTAVMRADLTVSREGAGFSSGGYSETRNILFIDPAQKAAYWLLPDDDHIIGERFDVKNEKDATRGRILATAVLVKPLTDQPESTAGRLILFDASGKNIVEVATDVRDLHVATLNGGDLTLLYERGKHLVSAAFDPLSLAKKREQEIDVPQLK
ncbi:MAG TPA: hypothetical protein VHV29_09900 [Terriglobales bacterium]|jgi:hypothetical protein|nr:hypothetical protein [Terriglobales bacterium]